ncbi:penicillin-binding transpeptidase domain-containing protein [Candidatus Clostridium radicumherbarum]|uniref:Penicillin-binding transpeptidase domain-containing protein n=1 Tax=Candidatus Clostridium radicumherbarum TaxID=3381662 RepID=A0ABW8TSM6_9CLOT
MHRRNVLKRTIYLLVLYILLFSALWWRLKVDTVDDAGKLGVWADMQYSEKVNLSELNYSLLDINGKPLLNYKNKYYAVIDEAAFKKNNLDAKSDNLYALIYILQSYNPSYDLSTIGLSNKEQKLTFEVDENTYNKLKSIKDIKGFYIYSYSEVDRSKAWKIENLLTNIMDPSGDHKKSEASLEMQVYNKTKGNEPAYTKFAKDVDGNITSETSLNSENNNNVRLTIDKDIEDKINGVLNSSKYTKFNQISAVLMESNTGKILSMNQKDDTQANLNLGSKTENGFEPGSIFKAVVEETGFMQKSLSLAEEFSCKQKTYSGQYDKCGDKNHGILNAEEAFVASCNNIYAQIGDKVGRKNFLDTASKEGLFSKVLGFDSEVTGDYAKLQDYELSGQLAIGQSMRITPVQALAIPNTIINGGIYVKPYIIDAYVDNNNNVKEQEQTQSTKIFEKSTANIMKNEMIKVVRYGTGTAAYIDNIEVGGKTGTTTRYNNKTKASDGWFAGFFKIKDKYYSMVVFVKDIDTKNEEAANTAVPIFKDIILSLNSYLQK